MRPLPPLPTLEQVSERLSTIFPTEFPDRSILVGELAARLFFVALYGGYVAEVAYFRPSTVIRFSKEQAALTSDLERVRWAEACQGPGYKALGTPWYAENSRETLRDDLIRNRAIPIGLIVKLEGLAPSTPLPIYAVAAPFASLFSPTLRGSDLERAVDSWRLHHLDPMTLRRMRLLAHGVSARKGQVTVDLPTSGKTLRLAPGDASVITKAVCEVLSKRLLNTPVVVHVSVSDQKKFIELEGAAAAIGLNLKLSAELPDVVMVDIGGDKGMTVVFVEVVHTDGVITELRKHSLLRIAAESGIAAKHVQLVTAFEDRNSAAFKKRLSELAMGSMVWCRTEPSLVMTFDALPEVPAA